jgi:hypothetical protein
VPRVKTYPTTQWLVHYGTDIYAVKSTAGADDAYKTIYCAHDDTMEVYKSLTIEDTIHYFHGEGGYLWCLTQIGSPPTTGKITLIDVATLSVIRTSTIDFVPYGYSNCDASALYIAEDGEAGAVGTVTRIAASDGTTTTYTGDALYHEERSAGNGVYVAASKVFWSTQGGARDLVKIEPSTMTRDVSWGSYAPMNLLSDGTYLYFWTTGVYQTLRIDLDDLKHGLNESGYWGGGIPRFYPEGMFLYGGYAYILSGATMRKTKCSDMVCESHPVPEVPITGASTTDGVSVWGENVNDGYTSAGRLLLSDWSYIDNIWLWTGGDGNAVWYMGI